MPLKAHETVAHVRRLFFVEHMIINGIAEELHIHRDTVSRALAIGLAFAFSVYMDTRRFWKDWKNAEASAERLASFFVKKDSIQLKLPSGGKRLKRPCLVLYKRNVDPNRTWKLKRKGIRPDGLTVIAAALEHQPNITIVATSNDGSVAFANSEREITWIRRIMVPKS